MHGFAVALGLLEQKLHAEDHHQAENETATVRSPAVPLAIRVDIERLARRLAGYRQGREITNRFFALLTEGNPRESSTHVDPWLQQAADPHLDTIVPATARRDEGESMSVEGQRSDILDTAAEHADDSVDVEEEPPGDVLLAGHWSPHGG